ncbi:hypothetical protein HXX76_001599 [Chlamydomonas incerta]|uniref:Adenosylcobinamide-GDP ribazoletransferase n=1 Tax=Chlamydomonas incerta TaxID=51695 RepID=A0A835WCG3_CHLIN|nr:hypothetical protein HXX76_001599 [Chlamydomonas incerta]|eukprot:KAG2444858.1 hypothetical protein HXX76_001599 [Chlamydomonas incerta]
MAPNKRGGPPSEETLAKLKGKKGQSATASKPKQTPGTGAAAVAVVAAAAEPCDYASGGAISKEEVEARGAGTDDHGDTYTRNRFAWSEWRVFFTGLMFLTRLPVPPGIDHHPAFLVRSMMWFPLLGAIIGGWGAVFYNAAAALWPPAAGSLLPAAISTFSTVWLTGCFHEDGLADTFDGFGGGWGRSQILRIMKDSRVGTYALVGTALALQLKTSGLAAIAALPAAAGGGAAGVAAALVAAHAASRWTSMVLIYGCDYIQDDEDAKRGMYNWFAQSTRLLTAPRLALGTLQAVAIPLLALGPARACVVYATVAAVTAASGLYGNSVLGGVIGDYLGATIQVAEILIYCALSADWARVTGSWDAAAPLLLLAGVAALPVIYCRRIVDWGNC